MRRVYRFDATSQRLEGMEAYLHQPDGDALVFEIKKIEYDQPIDPALFSLKVPENVEWLDNEPAQLPDNKKSETMTPQQAAQAFFEACAKQNWNEAEKFCSGPLATREGIPGRIADRPSRRAVPREAQCGVAHPL